MSLSDVAHLRGSPHRDAWRYARKQLTNAGHWGLDADWKYVARVLVDNEERKRVVASLDIKQPGQEPTFAEVADYLTELECGRDVFIGEYFLDGIDSPDWAAIDIKEHAHLGRINVYQVVGGDERPKRPVCITKPILVAAPWTQFNDWEEYYLSKRSEY